MDSQETGAFVSRFVVEGAPGGPLAGLDFAAKDIFDVAGHPTGCGNPDWLATHPVPQAHAAPVAALLGAGARLVGKTLTDEIAYSLMGANAHYGTPLNTAAPDRVPGGSSSGSVSAVAAGEADIGLGSDTGGSVRMPASFCGVWGLRTTHGRVPIDGAMPLAPSYDTVGWFTRNGATMARLLAAVGLGEGGAPPARLLLPVDAWARAGAETVAALAPALARIEAQAGAAAPVILAPEGLDAWRESFRLCQGAEIWQTHGDWVSRTKPRFGPGVEGRFRMASAIAAEDWEAARAHRRDIAARMQGLLGEDAMIVLPTGPGPAPRRDAAEGVLDGFRTRALELLCPAGHAGLPQLSVPAGLAEGAPVGISLIGPAGSEARLVALALAAQAG